MHLHEYQIKTLFEKKGIPTAPFEVVESQKEVEEAFKKLGLKEGVLKIQIHAGGRGKAGGVKLAKDLHEAKQFAKELCGMKVVNAQTGPNGLIAHKVLITSKVEIEKEYYAAILIDRKRGKPVLLVSSEGGVEIEETARKTPEKILTLPFEEDAPLYSFQLLKAGKFLGWKGEVYQKGIKLLKNLAALFKAIDATLIEINPLVLTKNGQLLALDGKATIDDSALFRHTDLKAWDDLSQITTSEARAKEAELAYIQLEGNIGCMVNGAGLAMSTMDLIKQEGGNPANFLDVGGSAPREKIALGVELIFSDPNVKVLFVNIFGGIMNCELLAQGVIDAYQKNKYTTPIVLRMEGTSVEEGKKLFSSSTLQVRYASTMKEGAKEAVSLMKGKHGRID